MSNTAKENILLKIKRALVKPMPVPFPAIQANTASVFNPSVQELEIEFAENFTKLLGKFAFCADEKDLAVQLNSLALYKKWNKIVCQEKALKNKLIHQGYINLHYASLSSCDASITTCETLVARTGSIVLSSATESGRSTSVYAPVHICIAYTSQLVYDIQDALINVQIKHANNLPSLITLATGPSRTADIEKTLVVGVHGPKEVFLFLVDDSYQAL
jgi:L-lactate dehydrogenase complex protein LldG